MVKTSILQKICPICNKEYNYKVIEDDGINWLGLRTSDGKTEVIDKGCPHCKNTKKNNVNNPNTDTIKPINTKEQKIQEIKEKYEISLFPVKINFIASNSSGKFAKTYIYSSEEVIECGLYENPYTSSIGYVEKNSEEVLLDMTDVELKDFKTKQSKYLFRCNNVLLEQINSLKKQLKEFVDKEDYDKVQEILNKLKLIKNKNFFEYLTK